MKTRTFISKGLLSLTALIILSGCSTIHYYDQEYDNDERAPNPRYGYRSPVNNTIYYPKPDTNYADRMPAQMDTKGRKMIVVDPRVHTWGAYDKTGKLVKAGIATSGGIECPPDDPDEPSCRTTPGTFRIFSLGDEGCYSKVYPRPEGGGLMPYCMYFNGGQALHGSPDVAIVEANVSHGCVRMRIPDAAWVRFNFAEIGTTVKVLPYD